LNIVIDYYSNFATREATKVHRPYTISRWLVVKSVFLAYNVTVLCTCLYFRMHDHYAIDVIVFCFLVYAR